MPKPTLHPNIRQRVVELANEIMVIDRKYHQRKNQLQAQGAQKYHIDNDPLLKQYSGATKTLSDMCTALSLAYLVVHPVVSGVD